MPSGMLIALLVSLIVIGAVVLLGVLGYLIDQNAEPAEPGHHAQHKQGKGA